jgi:hypothetical protein
VSRRPLYSLWILCVTLCYSVFQSLPDLTEFCPLKSQLVSNRVSLAKALVDRLLDSIA